MFIDVCAQHCNVEDSRGLGLSWRKFGYSGPPYCKSCAASFRNHIIRQRGRNTQLQQGCCRANPCELCVRCLSHEPTKERNPATAVSEVGWCSCGQHKILSHFQPSGLPEIYALFDSKKRAERVIPLVYNRTVSL